MDEVAVPELVEDSSYARMPDGSSNWEITDAPTPKASNG